MLNQVEKSKRLSVIFFFNHSYTYRWPIVNLTRRFQVCLKWTKSNQTERWAMRNKTGNCSVNFVWRFYCAASARLNVDLKFYNLVSNTLRTLHGEERTRRQVKAELKQFDHWIDVYSDTDYNFHCILRFCCIRFVCLVSIKKKKTCSSLVVCSSCAESTMDVLAV